MADMATASKIRPGLLIDERGKQKHPLFQIWRGMLRRCYCPYLREYKNYGGRGIFVCDRWRESFWNFVRDVGDRPSPVHSLDRKNNNGPYSPVNVVWATGQEQSRNRRSNHFLNAHGKKQTLEDWVAESGIPKSTLFNRIRRGWPDEKAVNEPVHAKAAKYTVFPPGGYHECQLRGINFRTIQSRLRRGWSFQQAIERPISRQKGGGRGNRIRNASTGT